MFVEFALKAKEHTSCVQKALFSIESSLGKFNKDDNVYVNIFRAELIRRALIHDIDKCEEVVIIDGQQVPYQFAEYTVGSDYFFSKGGAQYRSTTLKNITKINRSDGVCGAERSTINIEKD